MQLDRYVVILSSSTRLMSADLMIVRKSFTVLISVLLTLASPIFVAVLFDRRNISVEASF